ncbi:hypothetical protein J6590_048203 [Homalodisca vitripennis]|nr:hypothetical protein J6590_048203 [Homalodisca vitripennis]
MNQMLIGSLITATMHRLEWRQQIAVSAADSQFDWIAMCNHLMFFVRDLCCAKKVNDLVKSKQECRYNRQWGESGFYTAVLWIPYFLKYQYQSQSEILYRS